MQMNQLLSTFDPPIIIHAIIFANGIYDILCALSIKRLINFPILNELHLSMFRHRSNVNIDVLAVWIFANGMIRCSMSEYTKQFVVLSYYLEAAIFTVELIRRNVFAEKTVFVIASSILLGYFANKT